MKLKSLLCSFFCQLLNREFWPWPRRYISQSWPENYLLPLWCCAKIYATSWFIRMTSCATVFHHGLHEKTLCSTGTWRKREENPKAMKNLLYNSIYSVSEYFQGDSNTTKNNKCWVWLNVLRKYWEKKSLSFFSSLNWIILLSFSPTPRLFPVSLKLCFV